jgi:hypothetical protein
MDWKERRKFALEAARTECGLKSRGEIMLRVIAAVCGIAVLWTQLGPNEALSEFQLKVTGTAVIILAFPAVFLWKLFRVGNWIERHAKMLMIFFGSLVAIGGIGIAVAAAYQTTQPKGLVRGPLIPFETNPEITWDFEGTNPNISFLGMKGPGPGIEGL